MKSELSHRGKLNITLLISTSSGAPLAISVELDRDNDIDIIAVVAFKNELSFTCFILVLI